jgi:hypothetical protein
MTEIKMHERFRYQVGHLICYWYLVASTNNENLPVSDTRFYQISGNILFGGSCIQKNLTCHLINRK